MATPDVSILTNYYIREGMYKHVFKLCDDVLAKQGGTESANGKLIFWRAFALMKQAIKQGYSSSSLAPSSSTATINQAMREFETQRSKRDLELAVSEALLYCQNEMVADELKDHESISSLQRSLNIFESRAPEVGLLLTATFCLHIEKYDRAAFLVDTLLKRNESNIQALILKGWIELLSPKRNFNKREGYNYNQDISAASKCFEQALMDIESNSRGSRIPNNNLLRIFLGKAEIYKRTARYNDALECFNKIVVRFEWFLPALCEKAKLLTLMGDWDQAYEASERVLQQNSNDLQALRIQILYMLAQGSAPTEEIVGSLRKLFSTVEQTESENAKLFYDIAGPFARIASSKNIGNSSFSGSDDELRRMILKFAEKAKHLEPNNTKYATECAYQLSLMQKYEKAQSVYETAAEIDKSNVKAIFGQIYCSIKQGELNDASQQLEVLSVVQDTIGRSADLTFLDALLCWRRDENRTKSLQLLDETFQLHVKALRSDGPAIDTFNHFLRFNPCYLLEIAQEYMQHCGSSPIDPSETVPRNLVKATKILEKILKHVPGFLDGQFCLAHAQYLANEAEASVKSLSKCLKIDPGFAAAHLMQAQVLLHLEDFPGAQNALEQALSHNFEVRNSPLYHLIKSRVLNANGDLEGTLATLESAMDLPGVRSLTSSSTKLDKKDSRRPRRSSFQRMSSSNFTITLQDRASIFIELASVFIALKRSEDANRIIKEAQIEFKGTTEEVRILVIKSEIALKHGDSKLALAMLKDIPSSSPAYIKAHLMKANIYLNHRNDKDAYIRCFLELVDNNPNQTTYVLLGEAYIKINMPDEAIDAFENALRKNPTDSALARKIGKALLSTHDYARAIDYYKSALRSGQSGISKESLRYDLAELYYKLKNYPKAVKELEETLSDFEDTEGKGGDGDAADITVQVRALRLLAKVHKGAGNLDAVVNTLEEARKLQGTALSSFRNQQSPDAVQSQKMTMADICTLLAQHYEDVENDTTKAISFYNEALRHDETHISSMLALAQLYLRGRDLDKCQKICTQIIRVDPNNIDASMMLADLMFEKGDFSVATYHYQQLLEKTPNNFVALAKLVVLLFRAGKLNNVQSFILAAEKLSVRSAHDPGLYFCKGLYHRYGNQISDAISNFNMARKDVTWGQKALKNMVEIYLNPDNANLWEDAGLDQEEEKREAIETAKQLLSEIHDTSSLDYKVLECYALMASKGKSEIETALQKLVEIVNDEKEYVPALLALSTVLMLMKQTPKARNQLKRISRMEYNQAHGEEFEKSWLLLAEIFCGSGKYDLAQELCNRCLQYNQSCAKAWECLGMINEKEASYVDSAEKYEQAWKYQNQASAPIGYKLAFNYLKAKRYVDAIDVSTKVLKQYPDYPKIRKDILEKAQVSIRL